MTEKMTENMTEPDKTGQELNEKQYKAIDLILAGKGDQEIADACEVTRQTVNFWRNQNQPFILELYRVRQALRESYYGKLSELTNDAITVIQQSLKDEDKNVRLKAAIQVLKAQGLYGQIWNPLDPNELQNGYLRHAAREYAKERQRTIANIHRETVGKQQH